MAHRSLPGHPRLTAHHSGYYDPKTFLLRRILHPPVCRILRNPGVRVPAVTSAPQVPGGRDVGTRRYGQIMADFSGADLRGSRFERTDLSGSEFWASDLAGARFRGVDMSRVVMRGVELVDVEITGEIVNLTVNGVDVAPLIEAELNRRYPDRAKMRPADPAGFREAWEILTRLWDQTVARARRLPPELLHESVGGEWSFTETLRHLVFATDAWISRAIGGDPSPWDPLDLPWDEMPDTPGMPRDRGARPSLETVL